MRYRIDTITGLFILGLLVATIAGHLPSAWAADTLAANIADARTAVENARLAGAEKNGQDDLTQAKSWLAQAEGEYARSQSLLSKSLNLVRSNEARNKEIEYLAFMAKTKGQIAETKAKKAAVELELANAQKELADYRTTLDILNKKLAEAEQAKKIKAQAEAEQKELALARQKAAIAESQKMKELEEARKKVADLEAIKQKEVTEANLKGQQLASQKEKEEAELQALRKKMTALDKAKAMLTDGVKIPGAVVKTADKDILISIPASGIFSAKNDIHAKGRATLDELANYLKKYAGEAVTIRCYSDNAGKAEANRAATEKRARKVKEYLVDFHDIPADRILAKGLGANQPVADNSKASGRALNRRIEIGFAMPQ